jgi:hypothetical protein
MKKKTLNEMFESLNGINPQIPESPGIDISKAIDEVMSQKLNPTAVKAFLLKAKQEFNTVVRGQGNDVRQWAMNKVNVNHLFSLYEPNEKMAIASNLVLYVSGRPSPFDQFFPQLKEDNPIEGSQNKNDYFKTNDPNNLSDEDFYRLIEDIQKYLKLKNFTGNIGKDPWGNVLSDGKDDIISFVEKFPLNQSVLQMNNQQVIAMLGDEFINAVNNSGERSHDKSVEDYYNGDGPVTDRERMDQARGLK